MQHAHAFLDTNVLLHYKSFTEIPWRALLQAAEVTLIISSEVLQELETHSHEHPKRRVKERAKTVLRQLSARLLPRDLQSHEQGTNLVHCGIPFNKSDPSLLESSADDRILYQVLQMRESQSEIVLVTTDLNLLLKARLLQIATLKLPNEMRLPHEEDKLEKEVKELRRQLAQSNSMSPVLKVEFAERQLFQEIVLAIPPKQSQADKEAFISTQLAGMNLKQMELNPNKTTKLGIFGTLDPYDPDEVERYNERLRAYPQHWREFADKREAFTDLKARSFSVVLVLSNTGTKPAEDIAIQFHIPDGCQVFESENEENPLLEPSPPYLPEKPRTHFEKFTSHSHYGLEGLRPIDYGLGRVVPYFPGNVSSFEIKRSSSYDIDVHVDKLRHLNTEELGGLTFIMESWELVRPFKIEYTIVAGNAPKPFKGELGIKLRIDV